MVLPSFNAIYRIYLTRFTCLIHSMSVICVAPGFTGFYLVSSRFTEFYVVLLSSFFYVVLTGFTEFYLVLPSTTVFNLVSLWMATRFRSEFCSSNQMRQARPLARSATSDWSKRSTNRINWRKPKKKETKTNNRFRPENRPWGG